MTKNRPIDDEFFRVVLVFAGMLVMFLLLAGWLWRIQVVRGHEFRDKQVTQSVRRVRVPGTRGRMFDRSNVCLADNRPSFNVALSLEELPQTGSWSQKITRVEKLINELSAVIRKPAELTRDDIRSHAKKRLPLPLLAWRDIDEAALARIIERAGNRSGIDISADPVRFYPQGKLACHALGYVGKANVVQEADNENEDYHYFLNETEGKSGLEKMLDKQLRGVAGDRVLRVDVAGYRRDDVSQLEPQPGNDVMLTLDSKVQKLAERALGDVPGAAVVIDPRNGDVLALASSPGFDPNKFLPSISVADWDKLSGNEDKPLLNRTISEHYAPGSTFKPVTMMAALESGRFLGTEQFTCPGYFNLGSAVFHCFHHNAHGTIGAERAIEHSCNVYFFHVGLACGSQPIHDMAAQFGLGRKTGIELEGETSGINPDDAWKRRTFREGWRDGDTCNFAIGQGYVAATPLQMALVCATVANGGNVYRPRLVLGTRKPGEREFARAKPELVRRIGWSLDHLNLVRRGMFDVVMSPEGTGRGAHAPGIQMAGKTGSAQFESKEGMKTHAWMLAFAPFNDPRYAIAMVVDEGVSGGETIAPRIKQLVSGLFPQGNETSDGASG